MNDVSPSRLLAIEPIDAVAFEPFGSLVEGPVRGVRQDRAAHLENGRPGVAANLALIRSEPFPLAMPLRRLERHPLSSQAFLPLSVAAYLVVVAPDRGGLPDEDGVRAFRIPGHVGINYRAGAWHAHMMTLSEPGTFAMLAYEDGSEADCEFAAIAPVVLVEAA